MAARSPHMFVVRRLLLAQLTFAVFFPLVLLPFGVNAALSAAAGGFISFVPNSYFAYRTFQYSGARAAHEIVRSTFAGQFGKWALTMLFFIVLFKYFMESLNHAALFSGFIVVQLVIWLTPLLANWKPNSSI